MISTFFKRGLGWVKVPYLSRSGPTEICVKYFCEIEQKEPELLNENQCKHFESTDEGDTNEKAMVAGKENQRTQTTYDLPEEPTTCCMSGCANCVWLEYAAEMSEYFKDGGERAIKEINERVNDPNIKAFLLHELRMRKI